MRTMIPYNSPLTTKFCLLLLLLVGLSSSSWGQTSAGTINMSNTSPISITTGTYITYYDNGGPAASYGANRSYIQTFTADNGQPLVITFTQFALQGNSNNDYLIIHDGPNTSSPGTTYTRNTSPGTVRTSGGSVTFEFVSNNNTGGDGAGWTATITSMVTTDPDVNTCSATFSDKQGTAANYTANQYYKVTYRSTTHGQKIRFSFTDFDLGTGDQLVLRNGDQLTSPIIGTYTGTGTPGTITSADTTITAIFSSNNDASAGRGWAATVSCYTPVIFYSYTNGTWNDPATWTLDASGTVYNNPSSLTPTAADNVVILNGRTVTVTNSGNTVQQLEIQEGAILDVQGWNNQNYGTISGKGRLRSTSGDLPTGTYTLFAQSGGGTIELYGNITGSPDLNLSTFNNLEMNGNSTQNVYMVSNTTVNGNILIKGGTLNINHNGTTNLDITVNGNITVNSGCTFNLGAGNASHNLYVKGDFENEGTVIFTNQTIPNGYTNNHAESVTLIFNNTTKNQNFNCNGPTTLCNLYVDKGTDDTYMLDVNASLTTNFRLYGRNDSDPTNTDSPGDVLNNKALEVLAGTLRLGSNITIPRLTTDNSNPRNNYYVIDQDATIILDGSNVTVTADPTDITSLIIYGKLKVMGSSTLSSMGGQGIILREYGVLEIEGTDAAPTINTTVFRTSSRLELGTHRGTFKMSGGILNISGDNYADTHPAFALPFGDNTFQMTGGTINITNSTYEDGGDASYWSWLVSANESNISVTGGTVNINASARNAYINSKAPFYNLNFTGGGGYTCEIGSIADQYNGGNLVVPASAAREVIVLNNLSIGAGAQFIANDQNVTVGSNFTLNATGTYTPGVNTTTFNGYSLQDFTNAGTITSGLYNLTLTNYSLLTISNDLTIRNALEINSENTLRDQGHSINVGGDITNNGIHESATGGSIILNGTGAQNINGNGEGVFGNLSLNKTAGTSTQNANFNITGNLRLANTAAVLNIGSNKLALSATSNIFDNLILNTTSGFSSTRMVQTAGIQSDLGIERNIASIGTYIYPFGSGGKYTPARLEIAGAPADNWGSITINPVNSLHPLATSALNTLTYYWNIRRSEMSGFTLGDFKLFLYYNDADIVGDEDKYVPAYYYPISWTFIDNDQKVTNASNEILFDAVDQIRGHYTAGEKASFGGVQTYYSNTTNGDWDLLSSWTNDPLLNTPVTVLPNESSPVIIRSGHTIFTTTNGKRVGSLTIQGNAVLDLRTTTGHFFGLIYQTTVAGRGKLRISSSSATAQFPGGDFGEFLGTDGGTVEYYTTGTQDFSIPAGTSTTTTILNEGFEGTFPPSGWSTYSNAADEGGPQWERSTARAHTGAASSLHTVGQYWDWGTWSYLWYYNDDMLISPAINLSATGSYELSFWRNNNNAGNYSYQGVWISTTNKDPGSFTELVALGAGTEDTWTKHTIDLSSYSGKSKVYIAFVYRGDNADDVYIDDITVTKTTGSSGYHHLECNPASSRSITLPGINLTMSGNFTVKGAGTTITTNLLSSTTTVVGKTKIQETGTLRIDNTKTQTFILNDSLTIANGSSLIVNTAGASAVTHRLKLYGNVVNSGTLNLNPGSSKFADLYFMGTNSVTFSGSGTTANINRVYVDKGTSQAPVIDITASTFNMNPSLTQALTITNGTIRFSGASLTPVLTTSSSFSIPETGCLSVNGSTVTVGSAASNAADIYLSGKLEVRAGTMNVGAAANNTHNDIEYGTSGTPEVAVSGGTLNVNGQIRRSTLIATGNLTYRQSGGDVYIYGKNRDANQIKRALLEVLNSGSFYSSGTGNLYLVQGVSSTEAANTFGELYLNPATYDVTGGTIHTGTSTTGAATNYFNLYLGGPIYSLTVNGATNAKVAVLKTFPATLNGNLTIGTNGSSTQSSFKASSLDVNIGGNLINYSSASTANIYIAGVKTQKTTFTGIITNQKIENYSANYIHFGTLTINNTKTNGKVNLAGTNHIVVDGDLEILSGELQQNAGLIIVLYGSAYNYGVHSSQNVNAYLDFTSTKNQYIYGNDGAVFGSIAIASNKALISNISLRINTRVLFGTNSKLNIGDKLLTFASTATVGNVTPTAFIITNGALSDQGVRREYSAAGSFTFPIGVGSEGGKFTPATLNVTNTGGAAGTITVKPVDAPHPNRTNALDDELQYFWSVSSTGFGATKQISHSYVYSDLDILGTENPNYVNARMYNYTWTKQTENVDWASNTIKFTGVNYIDGDYTAGDVSNWGTVYKYYSRQTGNWGVATNWYLDSPTGPTIASTAPNGNPVFIQAGHTITTNADGAYAGSVNIASTATLDLGAKIGHNMGVLSGAGTIHIDATGSGSFVFPGGDPSLFMNTTGSTVHYSGAGTLPSNILTYQNVTFSGNGDKVIPASSFSVLGNLTISGGKLDNTINNRTITLYGNWINSIGYGASTGFYAGTGTVILAGGNAQTITATGTEYFYNLTVNKTLGIAATLNSPVNVNRRLTLTSGIVNTETNLLTMAWDDSNALTGGSVSSYIDGPLRKLVRNSGTFTFPVGDAGRYGPVYISGVTSTGNQYWTGRYYNTPPSNQTSLTSPLQLVSNNEYWEITGVAGTTANARIRWDASSQIIPATVLGRQKLRVAEYTTAWTRVGTTATIVDGGQTSGTIATTVPLSFTGATKQLTIGLELTASAQITGTTAGFCNDNSLLPVTIVVAGSAPLTVKYLINGAHETTLPPLSEGTHTINFTYNDLYAIGGTGDYIISLSSVVDKYNTSGLVLSGTATLTLYLTPSPIVSGPTTVMISTSNNYSVTNTSGHTYAWSVVGTTGGASATLTNANTSTVSAAWGATPGTVTLQLVETTPAPNSCSKTVTYTVTIRDWPVIVGNFNVCANSTETYQSKNVAGHTYIWSVVGGTIQSGAGTYSITVLWSTETAGTITLQQGPSAPYTEISQNVTINSAPSVTLTVDGSANICQNETVTLLLGRSGASALYTYYLEKDDAAYQTFNQTIAVANPYSFTTENLIWDGTAAGRIYKFSLRVVNNTTGCSSAEVDRSVTVWVTPETGSQYHISNGLVY